TTSKSGQLASEAGAVACATPAEVAKQADVVFLCVGDTAMVEEVLLGKDSVIEGGRKGMAVVDTSTISPSASVRIGEKFTAKGIDFLGAPVTGSTPGAINGTLTFMVGGNEKVFQS